MRRKTKEHIGYAALNAAFIILCLVTLVPIFYALSVSFSGAGSTLSASSPRTPRWKTTGPSSSTSPFCSG